ncbi:MAG: hypothetical protein KU28_01785 [Sulfurovum sp. PC08-66]|nr:MAG: hypothetical protein KU28_01785 [Sulfurovum sp. PC08-66]KIM12665.1 MAG: hypothetical protein KU37_01890 [Sulfuricurvum sp. PC08-66]
MRKIILTFFGILSLFAQEHTIFAPIANDVYALRSSCMAISRVKSSATQACDYYLHSTSQLLQTEHALQNTPNPDAAALKNYRNALLNEHKNLPHLRTTIARMVDATIAHEEYALLSYLVEHPAIILTEIQKERIAALPHPKHLSPKARQILARYSGR